MGLGSVDESRAEVGSLRVSDLSLFKNPVSIFGSAFLRSSPLLFGPWSAPICPSRIMESRSSAVADSCTTVAVVSHVSLTLFFCILSSIREDLLIVEASPFLGHPSGDSDFCTPSGNWGSPSSPSSSNPLSRRAAEVTVPRPDSASDFGALSMRTP